MGTFLFGFLRISSLFLQVNSLTAMRPANNGDASVDPQYGRDEQMVAKSGGSPVLHISRLLPLRRSAVLQSILLDTWWRDFYPGVGGAASTPRAVGV
jgi:hypothetical protein